MLLSMLLFLLLVFFQIFETRKCELLLLLSRRVTKLADDDSRSSLLWYLLECRKCGITFDEREKREIVRKRKWRRQRYFLTHHDWIFCPRRTFFVPSGVVLSSSSLWNFCTRGDKKKLWKRLRKKRNRNETSLTVILILQCFGGGRRRRPRRRKKKKKNNNQKRRKSVARVQRRKNREISA